MPGTSKRQAGQRDRRAREAKRPSAAEAVEAKAAASELGHTDEAISAKIAASFASMDMCGSADE